MKIMIAYASKTDSCKICAKELASFLTFHTVDIFDLNTNEPDISKYDICVIGGSIRMGKLDKKVYNYINKNKALLNDKVSSYYICNAFPDETERYFSKCFPQGVIESAFVYDSFGGELKIHKQKGLDKIIVKMILKENEENENFALPNIQTDAIGRFADKIKNREN